MTDRPEGPCPKCRKSIPLVERQGDLVLRDHHVVTSAQGYDVALCPGSQEAPADTLDDGRDWAWQRKAAARKAVRPQAAQEAMERLTTSVYSTRDAMRVVRQGVSQLSPADPVTVVLRAVQQAYADEAGPQEAGVNIDVRLDQDNASFLEDGPLTLYVRIPYRSERLSFALAVDPQVTDNPILCDALAREAADTVRRALREQVATRCASRYTRPFGIRHDCDQRGEHAVHTCGLCPAQWDDDGQET
ncbi:hypothetical protein [Streptomyces sp. NPDC046925]|uniref:hypothetical protein n=1 Tax=Streptomyces sp. NPDC046925 TaxID=3155375 RepID=UPI0033CB053F